MFAALSACAGGLEKLLGRAEVASMQAEPVAALLIALDKETDECARYACAVTLGSWLRASKLEYLTVATMQPLLINQID